MVLSKALLVSNALNSLTAGGVIIGTCENCFGEGASQVMDSVRYLGTLRSCGPWIMNILSDSHVVMCSARATTFLGIKLSEGLNGECSFVSES